MPSVPRFGGRLLARLLTPRAGIVAAVTVLAILLGCMSISIGKFGSTSSTMETDGVFCQEGEVTVASGAERDVFYPVPYAHPPHLEVSDTFNHCEIVQQREDSFKVRNTATFRVTLNWTARGVKGVPVPVLGPPPSGLPPPAPIPVGGTEPPDKPR